MRYALLIVAAGMLFGTTGTARALAPASASSLSIGAVRLVLGGLILGVVGLVRYVGGKRSGASSPPMTRSGIAARALVVAVCGAAIAVYQATFFEGTHLNGVMVGTILALGSSPLFAGALEWLVFRRRPGMVWLLSTAICIVGLVSLSSSRDTQVVTSARGVVDSLIAGLCYATLAVGSKWLLTKGHKSVDVAVATMTAGAVLTIVPMLRTDLGWLAEPRGIAVAVWLGIATVVVAYLLNTAGLAHTSASATTTLNLAEPATASVLGVTVLGEQLTLLRLLGIACVVAGVVLLGTSSRRSPAEDDVGPAAVVPSRTITPVARPDRSAAP